MPCSVRKLSQEENLADCCMAGHLRSLQPIHQEIKKKTECTEVAFSEFRDPTQDTLTKALIGVRKIWWKFSPETAKVKTDLHKNHTPMCTLVSQESALWYSVHYCSGSMCSIEVQLLRRTEQFTHIKSHCCESLPPIFLHTHFYNRWWSHAVVLYTISSSWGVPLFGSTALNNRTSWLPFCKISEPSSVSTHFSTWCCSVLMT